MSDDILEKFSENKRGRPVLGGDEYRAFINGLFPGSSERTTTNRIHAIWALKILMDDPKFEWLFEKRKNGNWKRFMLQSEIGRLEHPDLMRQAAEQMCKQKPTVKDGIVIIRRYRLQLMGKKPKTKGDQSVLEDELINLVDDFMLRFPDTDHQTILQALTKVYNLVVDLE